jgi:hypothetical protein
MELVSYQCNFKSPTCSLAVLLIHILSDSLTYRLIYSLILFTAHSSTQSLPHLFPPTPTRLPYTLSLTHKLPTLFLVCLVVRSIIRFLFWSPAHSLTRSLAHSPTHSLAHSPTHATHHPLVYSLAHSLTHTFTYSLTRLHTHSPPTYSLIHPLTRSLTHPPTPTHSLARCLLLWKLVRVCK